uniref:WGS project CAEQ00000000 data, annotated contig 2447 n=1 Tax=Trypanosoma congolense (strain IL3000) TaxID=1068625 RepID=F9WE85_TRYCI|nr:unnamed protein product [Trypanosoma congolense IL3000]
MASRSAPVVLVVGAVLLLVNTVQSEKEMEKENEKEKEKGMKKEKTPARSSEGTASERRGSVVFTSDAVYYLIVAPQRFLDGVRAAVGKDLEDFLCPAKQLEQLTTPGGLPPSCNITIVRTRPGFLNSTYLLGVQFSRSLDSDVRLMTPLDSGRRNRPLRNETFKRLWKELKAVSGRRDIVPVFQSIIFFNKPLDKISLKEVGNPCSRGWMCHRDTKIIIAIFSLSSALGLIAVFAGFRDSVSPLQKEDTQSYTM